MKRLFISFLLAALAGPAFADFGTGALRILCEYGTNRVEIEPYIAWNDNNSRFKAFQVEEAQSLCCMRVGPSTSFYSYSFQDRRFIHDECRTKDRVLRVLVVQERITVIEAGKVPIDAQEIGFVWVASGEIFFLRSHHTGRWELCRGSEHEEENLTCNLVKKRDEKLP
jgi:hypothetical protein